MLVAAIRENDLDEAERVLFGHIRRTRSQLTRHPEVFSEARETIDCIQSVEGEPSI
jgi:DNA-binding GntR family transcriptional regulator